MALSLHTSSASFNAWLSLGRDPSPTTPGLITASEAACGLPGGLAVWHVLSRRFSDGLLDAVVELPQAPRGRQPVQELLGFVQRFIPKLNPKGVVLHEAP